MYGSEKARVKQNILFDDVALLLLSVIDGNDDADVADDVFPSLPGSHKAASLLPHCSAQP